MILRKGAHVRDLIRKIQIMTVYRWINYAGWLISFKLSKLTNKVVVWNYPWAFHFEVASICNLRCPECIAGIKLTHRKEKFMTVDFLHKKLLDHQKKGFYCNLYFQGEPFLNPELAKMVRIATQLGFYSVISTNGHFLSPKNCKEMIDAGLSRIIISLDGIHQASYEKYRIGGRIEKVIDGIKTMAETRRQLNSIHPYIVVQFLVNKQNESEMIPAKAFVSSLGADQLDFKSIQIYTKEGRKSLLPERKNFNRYEKTKKAGKGCKRLWSEMVYTSDGDIALCCYDKKPDYSMVGKEMSVKDIWFSAYYESMRYKLLKRVSTPEICDNCVQ